MAERIKLSCPVKGCGWFIAVPKDTPKVPIMEYLASYHEFQRHLLHDHTFDQISETIYSYAISFLSIKGGKRNE